MTENKPVINCEYQMLWESEDLPACKHQPDRWCWREEPGCKIDEREKEDRKDMMTKETRNCEYRTLWSAEERPWVKTEGFTVCKRQPERFCWLDKGAACELDEEKRIPASAIESMRAEPGNALTEHLRGD